MVRCNGYYKIKCSNNTISLKVGDVFYIIDRKTKQQSRMKVDGFSPSDIFFYEDKPNIYHFMHHLSESQFVKMVDSLDIMII